MIHKRFTGQLHIYLYQSIIVKLLFYLATVINRFLSTHNGELDKMSDENRK